MIPTQQIGFIINSQAIGIYSTVVNIRITEKALVFPSIRVIIAINIYYWMVSWSRQTTPIISRSTSTSSDRTLEYPKKEGTNSKLWMTVEHRDTLDPVTRETTIRTGWSTLVDHLFGKKALKSLTMILPAHWERGRMTTLVTSVSLASHYYGRIGCKQPGSSF